MKKNERVIAIIVAILLFIAFFIYQYNRQSKGGTQPKISQILSSDDVIMVPNPPANITQPTSVNTIITQPDGTVIQKQYIYNPATTTIQIDSGYSQDNASLFFPGFALGFLFAQGNWVDHDGYYWQNNTWVHINDNHWNDHWHNYWHNNWNNNHWHNHWQANHTKPNWNPQHPEHWQHPGGDSPGRHTGGVREGGGRR